MTQNPILWLVALGLAWAVYRGVRAAVYITGLAREERRRDELRRRIRGDEPPVRRLLGWLRWLTIGIAAAGGYFAGLLAFRLITGEPSPEWLQPINAAVVISLLLSGDYIAGKLRTLEQEGRLDNVG